MLPEQHPRPAHSACQIRRSQMIWCGCCYLLSRCSPSLILGNHAGAASVATGCAPCVAGNTRSTHCANCWVLLLTTGLLQFYVWRTRASCSRTQRCATQPAGRVSWRCACGVGGRYDFARFAAGAFTPRVGFFYMQRSWLRAGTLPAPTTHHHQLRHTCVPLSKPSGFDGIAQRTWRCLDSTKKSSMRLWDGFSSPRLLVRPAAHSGQRRALPNRSCGVM